MNRIFVAWFLFLFFFFNEVTYDLVGLEEGDENQQIQVVFQVPPFHKIQKCSSEPDDRNM